MSAAPCLTVDVEDFYEGMHTLGHDIEPPPHQESGLVAVRRLLAGRGCHITLFVVGRWATAAATELRALASDGHEIASHGPDHGRLPKSGPALHDWLRAGREMVEEAVGVPVTGFRSPRFDLPDETPLRAFREAIAGAGFSYVSDTHRAGADSPVVEIPVAVAWHLPYGGGSYQRLIPRRAVSALVRRAPDPCVLYYHSYDFGHELPPLASARSTAVVAQVLGRRRIAPTFERLIDDVGSRTCSEAVHALR